MSTESENVEKKKLSYEELENVARQLSQQAQSMQKKLQEANLITSLREWIIHLQSFQIRVFS